ncbi:MAG: hypothetical protein PHV82_13265 [Victivallaceae bacterium]|nr:hypothetical protein [Victivallaceae bacterium]
MAEYDFSAGKGNILKDKSGNNNNGILHGTTWAKDKNGKNCLFFNGINAYVEIPFKPKLSLGQEFSVEMLVKPGVNEKRKGMGTSRVLFGQSGNFWDPASSFGIYLSVPESINAYFRYGPANTPKNNEVVNIGKFGLFINDWAKVTFIKSRKYATLYINSFPVKRVDFSNKNMINSGKPYYIGGTPGRYFKGFISNLKIYDYPIVSDTERVKTKSSSKSQPYLLLVTSMDQHISSTPLFDIGKKDIEVFNGSPFDGIALNMVDIYSAQQPVNEKIMSKKISEFKAVAQKAIWPRVNLNRIYQRHENHVYSKKDPCIEDIKALPVQGMSTGKARRESTYYFEKINVIDLYDEAGALSDFYKFWELSVKFSKEMKSGIVLDFEDYNYKTEVYNVSLIAARHKKPVDEVVKRLIGIGSHMVDMAEKIYPNVVIITLFLKFDKIRRTGYYNSFDYIAQGMLERAKEKKLPLVLVEGGEASLGYVNKTTTILKEKIFKRLFFYSSWLKAFPHNFRLGGTITIWDDFSKVTGWPQKALGTSKPFQSLEDFTPFLKILFNNFDYIWFYQPLCTDYKLFSKKSYDAACKFHRKLDIVMKRSANGDK